MAIKYKLGNGGGGLSHSGKGKVFHQYTYYIFVNIISIPLAGIP